MQKQEKSRLHAVKENQYFKQKEHFKYSKNPTPLEQEMNELLHECGYGDNEEVNDLFDGMFETSMWANLRMHFENKMLIQQEDFAKLTDTVKMFLRMKRVIKEMYVTFDAEEPDEDTERLKKISEKIKAINEEKIAGSDYLKSKDFQELLLLCKTPEEKRYVLIHLGLAKEGDYE